MAEKQLQTIIDKLDKIPTNQQLPQQLVHSCLALIQAVLASQLQTTRSELLLLINSLNQLNFLLPIPLSIQLISNYAQLNKSFIQNTIQLNLDSNPQFIHLFKLSLDQLAQELSVEPEQPQLAHTLVLITLSHPQLLELFCQPSSNLHHNSPFISIVRILENHDAKLTRYTRTQLIFILVKVLRDGIISRLKRATAAFDATQLVDQLSIILASKSRTKLTDLCLNYPDLLDEIDQLINNSLKIKSSSHNLSIKSKNQLNSFFSNSNDFLIFKIYNQFKSHPLNQNQILQVIENRKNLFDDHQMDVSLLRKGKSRLDEKAILNDKSHLTDSIKMKIKSRLEALERNPEDEDSDIPIIYNENDDESDELDKGEHDGFKKVKKMVQVDIFSDDDHLFFSNKNEPLDKSEEEEDALNLESAEEEEEKVQEGSRKTSTRKIIHNSNTYKQTNHHGNNSYKVQRKTSDYQKHVRGRVGEEIKTVQGEGESRGLGLKNTRENNQMRGGARGRGRGDIRSRGGGGNGRGGGNEKMKIKYNPNDKKPESASTQSNKVETQTSHSHNSIKADDEPVQSRNSNSTKLSNQRGRGAPPTRTARTIADHQKKTHDRRVRGRDRKLAHISAGI